MEEREAKIFFEGFIGSAKFLLQSVVDKMPEEDNEALWLKLGPSYVAVTGSNNVLRNSVVIIIIGPNNNTYII